MPEVAAVNRKHAPRHPATFANLREAVVMRTAWHVGTSAEIIRVTNPDNAVTNADRWARRTLRRGRPSRSMSQTFRDCLGRFKRIFRAGSPVRRQIASSL